MDFSPSGHESEQETPVCNTFWDGKYVVLIMPSAAGETEALLATRSFGLAFSLS